MIGGTIVQIVGDAVEVLEHTHLDRCWRKLENPGLICIGDEIWWQSYTGYLSRGDVFRDKNIGTCVPCNPHGRTRGATQ